MYLINNNGGHVRFINTFPRRVRVLTTRVPMNNRLTVGKSTRLWNVSSNNKTRVGRTISNIDGFLVASYTNTRNVCRRKGKTNCAGNMNRLRLTTLNRSNNCSILNNVTYRVTNKAIGLHKIFTKRNATAVANRTAMNIRSSFTTNRAKITLETARRGTTNKISMGLYLFISGINKSGQCGSFTRSINTRLLRLGENAILNKRRSNICATSLIVCMLSDSLNFTIKARVKGHTIFARDNRLFTRDIK